MSQMSNLQSQEPAGSQPPSRFQVAAPAQGPPSVARRIGLLLALVSLVVGVPALLVWLSGPPPVPTSLPGREDLTSSIGMEQVITVLVAIVWLAWLQFVTCLIVELFSTVRREGVPTPVPFSGPSQRLARALVGSLLLAGVVGGQVATVVNSMGADGARSSTTISAAAQPGQAGAHGASPQTRQGEYVVTRASVGLTAETPGPARSAPSEQSVDPLAPAGKRIYTVKAPVGHSHESLWQIAERHLGDGRRYKEIFALNEAVPQSDGSAMHLTRMIQPGWQLVMPEDAVGVARFVPPPAIPVTPVAPPASWGEPEDLSGPGSTAVTHDVAASTQNAMGAAGTFANQVPGSDISQVDQAAQLERAELVDQTPQGGPAAKFNQTAQSDPATQVDQTAQSMAAPVNPLIGGLATSGLFGACILTALLMQRARCRGGSQPGEDALDAEIGLRVGADLDRAGWLDSALRNLAATCTETSLRLPPVYAARVDDEQLELLLAPARTDAPDPWAVADEGRRWVLQRRDSSRAAAEGPAAYPALVCLGRDEQGRDVLIDLEASGGPVQITGDAVVASQVAVALAIQLATMPWSDTVRVSALGLPAEVAGLAGARINAISDLEPLVATLESRDTHAQDDVLTGRLARVRDETPEYIVLAAPISEALAARVATVTAGSRHPFGVVAIGTIPGAQWRLDVDETGALTLPLLAINVTAHRLLPRAQQAVVDLFEAAETEAQPQPGGRVDIPDTLQSIDDAAFAAAPVRVGILGPLAVRASGPMDAGRVPLAEEVITYLATHPDGVHSSVLAAAIWPRGVTHAVATATIDRVRDWLGDDPDGAARLRTDENGRYLLAPSVAVDWHSLCTLLLRARNTSSPHDEAELLRRALHLVRGQVLQDRPAGRYTWLVRTPLEHTIEAVVVDAAHRLAQISAEISDPEDSAEAVLSGLRLAPASQLLWRDLLLAEHQSGGAPALDVAFADLQETLRRGGTPVDAETDALVEHLRTVNTATGT